MAGETSVGGVQKAGPPLAGPAAAPPTAADLTAAFRSYWKDFEAAGDQAEQARTLPSNAVTILRGLGAFWLKTPAELGGNPLDPLSFCDVIEELAYIDVSVAWAAMIGAGCTGVAAGWLPDACVRVMFAPGRPLPVVAGQLSPRGTGTPVDGGYLVSGRWGFSSGIAHADWLLGMFAVTGASSGQQRRMIFAIPKGQAQVLDDWHVAGLRGTGSLGWEVASLFVPAGHTYEVGAAAVRGGSLFRLGMPAFTSNEVPPVCIGLARRVLDDMTALATCTARIPGGPAVSGRAVFQKELGRGEVRVRAARLVHREAMAAMWDTAKSGAMPSTDQHIAGTVASVFVAETCADVVTDLFRFGGGRVLALSSPMQRRLRDVLAARQHVGLSEETYEAAGLRRIQSATTREPQ